MSSIAEYYELKPARFGPIVSLGFSQSASASDAGLVQSIQIVLGAAPGSDAEGILRLEFFGVRKLRIQLEEWSVVHFGFLEINQTEDGYLLTEEEGQIYFIFDRFEAEVSITHPE